MRPSRPAHKPSQGAQRPPPPEATPGYSARWVAAQAIADALTLGKALDERFPGADGENVSQGLDPRDRALARSIATVAMRRLGTIRKGLGRFLEKGMPKKSGSLEGTLIGAAAQLRTRVRQRGVAAGRDHRLAGVQPVGRGGGAQCG